MKESEIKLLKDALINSIIENADLKNRVENAEGASTYWYKEYQKYEKKYNELKPEEPVMQPEPLDKNIEISKEL